MRFLNTVTLLTFIFIILATRLHNFHVIFSARFFSVRAFRREGILISNKPSHQEMASMSVLHVHVFPVQLIHIQICRARDWNMASGQADLHIRGYGLTKQSLLKIEIVFSISLNRKVIVQNKFGSKFLSCILQVLFITTNITLQSRKRYSAINLLSERILSYQIRKDNYSILRF